MQDFKRHGLEIADIFEKFDHLLGPMPPEHWKVIQAIKNCRTGALGWHLYQCDSCEFEKNAYNSCRNRHCPKCGFTARTRWVEKRTEELLPCPYFHVVFTLPAELRALILRNKEVSYNILFRAASETLKKVARNSDNLGVEIGLIGVLHTWSQTLVDHPHIHCIVPGGGLSEDKTRWVSCQENYLLPVEVLSQVFRGKILESFEKAFDEGKLKFMGQIEYLSHFASFKDLLIKCAGKEFNVHTEKPFAGPEAVLNYLGQYTHRIAISNYRLIKLEEENVHFKYRDPDDPKKKKMMILPVKEFMRRFLLHVLPKGFVRIRHFGLLGSRSKKLKINIIRKLLGIKEQVKEKLEVDWKELVKRIFGLNVDQCPKCRKGILRKVCSFASLLSTA